MRKSLLGLVLVAALLPVTSVYAAGEGTAKAAYEANGRTNAKAAIETGVSNGLTLEAAILELLESNPEQAASIISAAVSLNPANARAIAAFSTNKGIPASVAYPAAGLATPQQGGLFSGVSSTSGGNITVINNSGGSTGGGGGGSGSASGS